MFGTTRCEQKRMCGVMRKPCGHTHNRSNDIHRNIGHTQIFSGTSTPYCEERQMSRLFLICLSEAGSFKAESEGSLGLREVNVKCIDFRCTDVADEERYVSGGKSAPVA